MNHYQHVCTEERFYIWHALREGNTQQQIAGALGRHPSTVSRELKRNTYPQCHCYTYLNSRAYGWGQVGSGLVMLHIV